jgi:hypothetical protein
MAPPFPRPDIRQPALALLDKLFNPKQGEEFRKCAIRPTAPAL